MQEERNARALSRNLNDKLTIGLIALTVTLIVLLGPSITAASQTRNSPVTGAKKAASKSARLTRRRPLARRPRRSQKKVAAVTDPVSAEISAGKPIKPSETNVDVRTLPQGKPEHEGEGQKMAPVRNPPAAKAKKRLP